MCRTGLLHSKFWALLNKSPWQRAALQPRGGHLHQHHSVWTGQPGAAGQGPVQNGASLTFIQSSYPDGDKVISLFTFTVLPLFLSGWRGGPSKSLDEGYGPASTAGFFISFWLCSLTFLKVCFPKPADLLVIFLPTSVKRYFIYIWHILLSPPSVKSSFGPIQSLPFVSVSVISSSFWLAAGGTTFSQDCAGCVWNHRPCIRISIKFKIKLYIFHTQQAAIVFETCFPLKRAILVISREEKLVPVCSSCLSPAVGGVTARGQPSAAKGSVVHVSLPGARRSCTLSAFKPHPTAGQEWLLHHYHPTDRFLPPLSLTLTSNHLKQQHVWGGHHHSQLYLLK